MPSSPILQAWRNTTSPSAWSRCSLSRRPAAAFASTDASVALRTSSGSRRKSSPLSSIRSHASVVPPVADALEARHAIVAAGDSLAVDDAGARAQARDGIHDQREAVRQVIAGATVEFHALTVLARDDAEAVVLDLVNPRAAARRLFGLGGKAGRNEAREGTQHGGLIKPTDRLDKNNSGPESPNGARPFCGRTKPLILFGFQ
jgi:hypothetical protein